MTDRPATFPETPPAERQGAVLSWLRGAPAAEVAAQRGITVEVLYQWAQEVFAARLPAPVGAREETLGPVGAPVRIRRDRWGIAHVAAETLPDLFFGLGYAMAQDRLWQLDYQRRLVRGQLAAILGPTALPSDRAMRTIGMGAAGDRAWETTSGEVREILEALSAGINHWIARVGDRLPIEFEILGYTPTPWRPPDSIAIWKHRWWTLTGRLELLLLAEAARRFLPPALQEAFFDVELGEETIVPGAPDPAPRPGRPDVDGGAFDQGSNNWVVGSAHSTTGAPIVCSDPHNPFAAPSQWFEAQLTCRAFDAAGAVYLGTPVLYLGRNREVAWGVTNHAISVRDLYREETDPSRPGFYRDGADWRPFAIERQMISVAGGSAEPLAVRRTVRGPIVNDLLPALDDQDRAPISLRWVGAEVSSGMEAALDLLQARSAADVVAALRSWPCPPLNFVYADRSGRFGYHAAGFVPRRARPGYGLRQANDPADAWQGFIPFEQLPHLDDPPAGWVATANNVPGTADPAYLASGAWSDGYRARRIRERLTATDRISPEEAGRVQADVQSGRGRDLCPALLAILGPGETPLERAAIEALAAWDFECDVASIGASIWTAFWTEWCLALARRWFPESLLETAATRVAAVGRRLLLGERIPWLDGRDVAGEVRAAFRRSLQGLAAWGGSDLREWCWGKLHQVLHPHPLGTTPERQQLFSTGPYPTSGGNAIVRAAGHGLQLPYAVISGSTYRFVADLSRPDRLDSVQTLGQSAHLGSPHYRDQTALWLEDRYHPFWMDEREVLSNLESELILRPLDQRYGMSSDAGPGSGPGGE